MKQKDHYRQVLRSVNAIGRLTNPQHLPALRERRISLSQLLALDGLGASREPMRMSELATAAGLAAGELSRVVAGLEESGWIKRGTDPDDGRAKRVSLTRSGRALTHLVHRQATADLEGVWSDFSHDEWHRFIDFLHRFESGLRRVRSSPPAASKARGRARPTPSRS